MRATTSRCSGRSSAIGFTVGMRSVNVSMPTIFMAAPPRAVDAQRSKLYHAPTGTKSPPVAQKGPDARRRPKAAREAYSSYVERAAEGANEADGPFSAAGYASYARSYCERSR